MLSSGLYTRSQVPRQHYEDLPQLNMSKLEWMGAAPALFHFHQLQPWEDSDRLIQGRAFHMATLEPERFAVECAVFDGKKRDGKAWDGFRAENAGKEWLTVKMHENAVAMSQAVRRDGTALPFISKGRSESTLIWKHAAQGLTDALPGYEVDCKGRIDFDNALGITDLKSTGDASPDAFGRTAFNLNYHVKAAWYSDGFALATGERKPYFIVAVEDHEPYLVQVYRLPDEVLELGRTKYVEWLDRYNLCRVQNDWPGYSDGPMDLQLPSWALPYEERSDADALGLEVVHA